MRKHCYTLEQFNQEIRRGNPWPVGTEIEMDDGCVYTVGQINPLLQATDKTLKEEDIAFVRY